jgi:sialate O-acetylesterase
MFRKLIVLICCLISIRSIAAIKLPAIIGDNMVLQRGVKVPLWGWATPGAPVTVTFNNKTFRTVTRSDGKWELKLDPYRAGGPFNMELSDDKTSRKLVNILIGDVWLASGQSNMEFGIQSDKDAADVIPAATDTMIRCFFVPWATALNEQDDIAAVPEGSMNGKWIVCSPSAMATTSWAWHGFSAPAYYFAQVLRRRINCAVGLIGSYKGGTPAQSWTSIDGLKKDTALRRYVLNHEKIVQSYDSLQQLYPAKMSAFRDAIKKWDTEIGVEYNKTLAAWQVAVEKTKLQNEPVPSRPQPSRPRPQTPASPDGGTGAPGNLYNGMIAPLTSFAIKGAIWYQGESNGDRMEDAKLYPVLFSRMIRDWRDKWKQGNFPFIYVQLTSFRKPATQPVEGIWPWVREAQLKTLSLPNTGMAVIMDAGDADDIHPKAKLPVGQRLAYQALKVAYGMDLVYSGPLFHKAKKKDHSIEIEFSNTGTGLFTEQPDGRLKGFAIAGADRKFIWADAVIKDGRVIVSSPGITDPVAVRYNWADNPPGDLANKERLPASPFRTDNWNE